MKLAERYSTNGTIYSKFGFRPLHGPGLFQMLFTKTVTKFLWLPLTLCGQTRWLTFATILYRDEGEMEPYERGAVWMENWKPVAFL
jgi:hypothetical protein